MTGHDLVGHGWAFPARIGPGGSVALLGGHDDVDSALRIILGTVPGERVMRPEFGCRIWEYVFAPITPATLGDIEHAVREAVQQWEPRIDLESVTAQPRPDADGVVEVLLAYRLRASNDHRNLVYPFYVIPREVTG